MNLESNLRKSALFAALLLTPTPAFAAHPLQEGEDAGSGGDSEEATTDEDENAVRWFAIVGGDVYPGTGGVLRGATILAKEGVIKEIGHDLFLPAGTEKLDARGMRVYPGLVALGASSRISAGLFATEQPESEPVEDRWAVAEDEDPWWLVDGDPEPLDDHFDLDAPGGPSNGWDRHLDSAEGGAAARLDDFPLSLAQEAASRGKRPDIEDGFDPFNSFLVLALATGITSAEQSNSAVKLRRGEIDDVVMNENVMTSLTWSVSNPSTIRSLREKFQRAAEYLRELRAFDAAGDKNAKEPSKRGVDASVLRVLKGETLPRFRATAREDLLGIARLAQEYGFRPVIEGCREGWTVADELGRAGAYAILAARERNPKDESLVRAGGASIENAAILHAAGVQVAIRPENTSIDFIGITGRDLLHLPVEAGFAVRGGLSPQAALEAITSVPARLLGVSHRVGTLEVGKDLDAIVTDGDLLHYQTFVQYAVVGGKEVYDKEEELYFAHIRPRPVREPLDPPAAEEATPADEATDEGATEADESKDEESEESGEEVTEESGDDEDGRR